MLHCADHEQVAHVQKSLLGTRSPHNVTVLGCCGRSVRQRRRTRRHQVGCVGCHAASDGYQWQRPLPGLSLGSVLPLRHTQPKNKRMDTNRLRVKSGGFGVKVSPPVTALLVPIVTHPRADPQVETASVKDRSSMFMWYVSRWTTTLSSPIASRNSTPCNANFKAKQIRNDVVMA